MYVYFLQAGKKGAIKIGVSDDVDKRVATLQIGNAFKLNIIGLIKCTSREDALYKEGRFHKLFARQNIRGEWFMNTINFKKIREYKDQEVLQELFMDKEVKEKREALKGMAKTSEEMARKVQDEGYMPDFV